MRSNCSRCRRTSAGDAVCGCGPAAAADRDSRAAATSAVTSSMATDMASGTHELSKLSFPRGAPRPPTSALRPAAPSSVALPPTRKLALRSVDSAAERTCGNSRDVLRRAVDDPARAVTRRPANAPSVAERRDRPEMPAPAPTSRRRALRRRRSRASADADAGTRAGADARTAPSRCRAPPMPMPALAPKPMPRPPPAEAKAAGGFNVIDALTVSGEPLPNRRLS